MHTAEKKCFVWKFVGQKNTKFRENEGKYDENLHT